MRRKWSALAAATAAGIAGGAATFAFCEMPRDPMTPYGKMCDDYYEEGETDGEEDVEASDPMTVYAIHAVRKEIAEEAQQQEQQEASVQATSAVDSNVVLESHHTPMTAEESRIEEATRKAKKHSGGLKIFGGNGNMALALEIARYLGINLGKATVGRFADGEVNVVIHENVRGKDCYVIQSTCPPVNDNIMELLLMVSTLRRASARRITVVIPYYGYARQDRKMQVCWWGSCC